MEKETRHSYDAYFDVIEKLEKRWRIVRIGDLYSLQYKNRHPNGWGKEPRGNASSSLEKIKEVYQTRVKQRNIIEKIKLQKVMEEIHLEGYYKQQAERWKLKPRKASLYDEYTMLI